MLSRCSSTFLKRTSRYHQAFSTTKEPWHYVIPLPCDVTTIIRYSQPFIIAPFRNFSVFNVTDILKNPENIFWIYDHCNANYNYFGYAQDVEKTVQRSEVYSVDSYDKLKKIAQRNLRFEEYDKALDWEKISPYDDERAWAQMKLAIAHAINGKEIEAFKILEDIIKFEEYKDDLFGLDFMLHTQFYGKLFNGHHLSQHSEVYERFMLYLAVCQNHFSRQVEYCLRRDKDGLKENPPMSEFIKLLASLMLHPIIKMPMLACESDFSYPIEYAYQLTKNSPKNKVLDQLGSQFNNCMDMLLIFALINKAGFYYERSMTEEMTSCFNQAMDKLRNHDYCATYSEAFSTLLKQLSANQSLVTPQRSFNYQL